MAFVLVDRPGLASLGPITLLDARPLAAFDRDPPNGAVRVPVEEWDTMARDPAIGLSAADPWTAAIRGLGIDPAVATPVVYDDGRMTEAARVWILLQHFGIEARVLDGGLPMLQDTAGLPIVIADPSGATARPGSGRVAILDRAEVRDRLGSVQILDVRTAEEFTGADPRRNPRVGHLPGARLLPHAGLLREDGTVAAAATLARSFSDAGLAEDTPVVTHCDAGGRAALGALALVEAGRSGISTYYLSFSDWSADEACPVVLG